MTKTQTVADFLVNVIWQHLIYYSPDIADDGTSPTPPGETAATISVQLQDNGGTTNGGNDTSTAATFTITPTHRQPQLF
ncbi:hypothetical protein [[Phormidium] sp. ETS-05]|uniref:hypothetical protein n=1 Tax=[Phormidium] sp. ETS-05 TaxID=222819 RepID=UPI0018EEFCC0|nr:hypothetical protein [[Phormidium] sp. ETS-05]